MDSSLPGSSVHRISQARILEWAAISCPGNLPNPGIESTSPALVGGFFTTEPPGKPIFSLPQPYTVGQWFLTLADAYNYLTIWGALKIIQTPGPNFQSFYLVFWGEAWELIYT